MQISSQTIISSLSYSEIKTLKIHTTFLDGDYVHAVHDLTQMAHQVFLNC